jgi:surface antigen
LCAHSALAAQGSSAPTAPTAHAANGFRYERGYSVQNGWLCYGWSNGVYHCTSHWHRSGSRLISLNPGWVPASGSSAISRAAGGGGGGRTSPTPGGISQWAYTDRPAYAMSDFRGDPYHSYFGACTWYAWYRHQNEPLMRLGMAYQWPSRAPAFGLRVGRVPVVGATVVFAPGVQGASSGGHAAHVEAVYGGGWFIVSEMSFWWNGGGWRRVSYRYAHTRYGVSFIY